MDALNQNPVLAVRRSRTSLRYWSTTAFTAGVAYYAYSLHTRSLTGKFDTSWLMPILLLFTAVVLWRSVLPPLFDRKPLLYLDREGLYARAVGERQIPWRDIADEAFEETWVYRVGTYLHFSFSQTNPAGGARIVHRIAADEFDVSRDEILAAIAWFRAQANLASKYSGRSFAGKATP